MASEKVMKSVVVIVCLLAGVINAGTLVDFEDLNLETDSYWNGSDLSGGFESSDMWFNNNYDSLYWSWDGFAYSNIADTTSTGWDAQYNAITGNGYDGSANYGVGFVGFGFNDPPAMTLDVPGRIDGFYVTNNNYAYYSMMTGDAFAKKFGGATGEDEDWFMLTVTGKDVTGAVTGTVDFYLADFRFEDNGMDYILDDWAYVDLTELGAVKNLEFGLTSSDTGSMGMNTPGYFVIDNIIVPEPITAALLALGAMAMRRKKL